MKLPVTERGRTTMAWNLLSRLVNDGEVRASIHPGEPLSSPGTTRRLLQTARMLLDLRAAKRAVPRG